MYYAKKNIHPRLRKGRVFVYDFSSGISTAKDEKLVPLYTAVRSFNTDFKSGALTDGFGISVASFSDGNTPVFDIEGVSPKRLYYYKKYDANIGLYVDYLLIYADNGSMYKARVGADERFVLVSGLSFEVEPSAVSYTYNGSDVIIFSAEEKVKVYDGERVTSISDAPGITSTCIHNERLFATEGGQKTALWFSDDFDPLNWNVSLEDAGYIDLRDGRGSLLKVVSFDGYVYVFRSYGISRITAYGDQTNFSVDGITASSSKIYPNSIAVCGDRVIYLTQDGFYSFAGGTPNRILSKLDGMIADCDLSLAKGIYYDGSYYCSLVLKEKNGESFPALLRYRVNSGEFTLNRYLNIIDFALMDGEKDFKLLFICEDNRAIGELSRKSEYFNEVLYKSWESGESDFGVRKEKRLTKLCVNSRTPIYITVKSEKESRRLYFFGGIEREAQAVGIRGEYFTITIECALPDCKVSYLSAEFEYEGG